MSKKIRRFIVKNWALLVVIIASLLAARILIFQSGYFRMHDDLQMMRQLEIEKCLLDGQFPCRWVPDMGFGYGFPLFNFYPPLPYIVGELFRVFSFSFVTVAKLTFALSFLVAGVGMYVLAKEFFGTLGGVVASVFYTWAPYHAVDVYVRGAMNEAWALAIFPFIFWTSYRLIKAKHKSPKWIIGLSLSWFALLTSHNLMVMMLAPFFGIWVLLLLWQYNAWSRLADLIKSAVLAFLLSAFFTIPVLLEQGLVQITTLVEDYFVYSAHFATINQLLFSRFWGYEGSAWETMNDGMSFQVGHVHWILSLIIGGVVVFGLIKKKPKKILKEFKNSKTLLLIIYLFAIGWFSTFMAHNRSTFIWKTISTLQFAQFPWRFLAIAIFSFSFLAGGVVVILESRFFKNYFKKYKTVIPVFLMVLLVSFNWNYFLPRDGKMGPLTDEEKFSGVAWQLQQKAGIRDYLPIKAKEVPREPQEILAEVVGGKAEISNLSQGTNWGKFDIDVTSKEASVRINIFDFPNWRVFVDGEEVEHSVPEEEDWGRMHVEIDKGEHSVEAGLFDTSARKVGNILSLASWFGLAVFVVKSKRA